MRYIFILMTHSILNRCRSKINKTGFWMDTQFGKILIITGIMFVIAGVILLANIRIPFMGKMPGDIFYQSNSASIFFPVTTCIVISIILTVLLNVFRIWK